MKQISQMRLSKIAMLLLISCLNSQYLCDLKSQKSNDWLTASSGSPNSMDFEGAWIKGYCGKGVNVGIIDSYVEIDHPDLKNAFDRTLFKGFDYNYGEEINYGVKNHGTNMVSVIAGSHKTFLCNKGLAPSAKIALISIEFGTNVLDSAEAASIEHRREDIDIYVMSWGPADDGKTIDGPGQQFKRALKAGTEYGRNGLGNIFIVASGNGGENYDDCNCDGYVANLYTISVGSFMSSGKKPAYQEHCAAMLVSVPDLYKHFTTGTTGKKCTNKFSGTSASAPVIASAIALALDANPLLTWRDVQHLLVYSASIPENFKEKVYTNAAGLQYSPLIGFGKVNVSKMTRLAQKWNEAPPHKMCKVEDFSWKIAGSEETRVRLVYDASKCRIKRSESIIYEFSSIFPGDRGQVSVEVISPSGTHSKLLSKRKKDHNVAEFKDVQMKSVHFWQESARGLWIVEFDWKVPKSKLSSIFESKKPEGAPQQPFILRSNLKIYGH